MGLCEISPFNIGVSIGVVIFQVLFSQTHCLGIMSVGSLPFLEDTILQQTS